MKTNRTQSLKPFFITIAVLGAVWLTATPASAFTVLAGWEAGGLVNSGPSPYTPTTSGTGLTIVGLTKGSGVTNTTTGSVWGGSHWTNASESAAITFNEFATFSIAPAANYTVSFNSVDKFYFSHSATGPASGELQYSLDGINFNDITSISYGTQGTANSGGSVTIDLSGVSALQNVGFGTNVTFRIVNWGASAGSGSGTWYIYNGNTSGNDFEVLGTITQTSSGIPPGNVSVTPTNITTNVNSTVSFTVSATGDQPTYSWYQEVGGTTNLVSTSGPTFTLPNVTTANSGNYQVVLVNDAGSITSSVVTLAVTDPAITASPANITNVLNDVDYFSATAVASQPAELYWYYNGALVTNFNSAGITNTGTIYVTNNPAATNLGGYYLVVSNQFGMATSTVATATIALTPSVEIARWDFNATNNYTATNPATSIGTGLGAPVPNPAVTNFIFAPGALFDPLQLVSGSTNEAWELDGFGSTVSNKTAGFQFNVSTAGYTNILLTWSERHSATASKYMRVQYSADGVNFVDGDVETFSAVAYQFYSSALTNAGVANNPNFAFRIVAEWESTAIGTSNTNYDGTSSAFGSGGTIRVDLMTVFGNPLGSGVAPIPLQIQRSGANVVLTWNDPTSAFSLQAAPLVTGTYVTVPGATSPYTNALTGAQQYFRLESN